MYLTGLLRRRKIFKPYPSIYCSCLLCEHSIVIHWGFIDQPATRSGAQQIPGEQPPMFVIEYQLINQSHYSHSIYTLQMFIVFPER